MLQGDWRAWFKETRNLIEGRLLENAQRLGASADEPAGVRKGTLRSSAALVTTHMGIL